MNGGSAPRFNEAVLYGVCRAQHYYAVEWTRRTIGYAGLEQWITGLVSEDGTDMEAESGQARVVRRAERIDRIRLNAHCWGFDGLILDKTSDEVMGGSLARQLIVQCVTECCYWKDCNDCQESQD